MREVAHDEVSDSTKDCALLLTEKKKKNRRLFFFAASKGAKKYLFIEIKSHDDRREVGWWVDSLLRSRLQEEYFINHVGANN